MGVTCTIDSVAGIVLTTVRAPTNAKEVTDALTRVIASPEFRPGLNGVADLREATAEWTPADLRWIVAALEVHRAEILPSRAALVVSEPAVYGVARMFQAYSGATGIDTRIFDDLDEATAWAAGEGDVEG